jgi:hypothetical protein
MERQPTIPEHRPRDGRRCGPWRVAAGAQGAVTWGIPRTRSTPRNISSKPPLQLSGRILCTARSKSAVDHARNRHLITQESGTASRSKPAPDNGANRHRVTG